MGNDDDPDHRYPGRPSVFNGSSYRALPASKARGRKAPQAVKRPPLPAKCWEGPFPHNPMGGHDGSNTAATRCRSRIHSRYERTLDHHRHSLDDLDHERTMSPALSWPLRTRMASTPRQRNRGLTPLPSYRAPEAPLQPAVRTLTAQIWYKRFRPSKNPLHAVPEARHPSPPSSTGSAGIQGFSWSRLGWMTIRRYFQLPSAFRPYRNL